MGDERVGTLSIRTGDMPIRGRVVREGVPGQDNDRVGAALRMSFVMESMRAARRWREGLAIVAAHPHLAPAAYACRTITGAPYAVWCHGIEVWGPIDRATRFALRRADLVFAPSRFTAHEVEQRAGLTAGSVSVVPHCVPPEFAALRDAGPRVKGRVLSVARLHPHHRYKGVDMLLGAWPSIVGRVPRATLTIVGDGPDRRWLERRSQELGVSSSVEFSGHVSDADLDHAYATSSVFAMPARHRTGIDAEGEGFGLVFVEAGAAGLPVIAGEGGGTDAAVEAGVSGLLVDPLDPSAIAEATIVLLTDPELRGRLGAGGRRLAETRYSFASFSDRIVDLIQSMTARGGVR
jgi:phosphatidylinositol alpha-1,6-mannosyltransferase